MLTTKTGAGTVEGAGSEGILRLNVWGYPDFAC